MGKSKKQEGPESLYMRNMTEYHLFRRSAQVGGIALLQSGNDKCWRRVGNGRWKGVRNGCVLEGSAGASDGG